MPLAQDAPAKINLGLHVLRRRPDGYHDIETVLHRIDWADTITATPADTLSLTCSDPSLPTDRDNLCLQAAHRLASACDVATGADLHLEKRVPYGAGLGSGSSDAAATLRLLARLWDVAPTSETLQEIGRTIGADVPFFLQDAPAAYATGRGDTLSPLSKDGASYRLPFPLLIAVPSAEIATPWAYDRVTPAEANRPDLRRLVLSNDLSRWDEALTNDFAPPVTTAIPAVDAARTALRATDAACVSLSGSGSAVYGLFEETAAARAALQSLKPLDLRTHLMPAPN
ncbi:4-diphosphocytidyl-2-C-methyl-D-erythritol kinase [Salinibacter ruber]|uniref:4-(cytidine 5'-diphospho)-2-C-methyl-D-erythritol kinase n=1 Tax=Salinibacter ruber TaxID=146919 RepID=UPI002169A7ED|nr:4-(cytidine 5'-diphospho)-2-C-methyl-D-erythritol kinase [Salinibacter ruber]MCS3632273.1 4-diphosphocytidyl-2-C-methyl-D-erythritol kinase [Salinibacter ruber]